MSISYCERKNVNINRKLVRFDGPAKLYFEKGADIKIGEKFRFCSDYNSIDNSSYGGINVYAGAHLIIGYNTGMTNTMIWCYNRITIGNHVNVGAGTMIVDTDFHSLDWKDRRDGIDVANKKTRPVVIKDYAFIGTRSIILKGVTIGEKSIIGAGSVVSKSVPDGEVWAGNPARFIKKIIE